MHVLVVDAFATEPMAGRPVAVLPETDLTDDQYSAIAEELGTVGALAAEPDGLRAVGPRADVAAAVAAGALVDEGQAPGERVVEGHHDLPIDVAADGEVTVELPPAESREIDVGESEIADALGIDRAALADVGADLPPARVAAGAGYLAVPVNFMEHLGGADPDQEWVAGLLDTVDAEALYAFTFDTLSSGTDWHARVFTRDGEVAASARAAAATGPYVRRQGAFDAVREEFVAASGHYIDRPSRVTVSLSAPGPTDETAASDDAESAASDDAATAAADNAATAAADNVAGPRVRGRALTVFDGTATVPESDEDDILEV